MKNDFGQFVLHIMEIQFHLAAVCQPGDISQGHAVAVHIEGFSVRSCAILAVQQFGDTVGFTFPVAETVEILMELIAQTDAAGAFQLVGEQGEGNQHPVMPLGIAGKDSRIALAIHNPQIGAVLIVNDHIFRQAGQVFRFQGGIVDAGENQVRFAEGGEVRTA